jgi:hypothetical protein
MSWAVDIFVFEDGVLSLLDKESEALMFWPGYTVSSTSGDFSFRFGQEWNGLGDILQIAGLTIGRPIANNNDLFLRAAEFLYKSEWNSCLFFFDLELAGISLGGEFLDWINTKEDSARVISGLNAVAGSSSIADSLRFFNESKQGLALATVCAIKNSSEVDLWLATSAYSFEERAAFVKRLSNLAADGPSAFVGSMASITSLRKNALLNELKSRCQAFVDRRAYSWRNLLSTTASSEWSHDAIDDASPDSFVGLHLTKLLGCKVEDVFVEEDGISRLHKNMREWLKQLKGHREFKLSLGAIWILFAIITRGRNCNIGEALMLPTDLPLVLPKIEGFGDVRRPKQVFDDWLLRLGDLIENFCTKEPSEQDVSLLCVEFNEVEISIHLRYP